MTTKGFGDGDMAGVWYAFPGATHDDARYTSLLEWPVQAAPDQVCVVGWPMAEKEFFIGEYVEPFSAKRSKARAKSGPSLRGISQVTVWNRSGESRFLI